MRIFMAFIVGTLFLRGSAISQTWQAKVTLNWDKVERISQTTPT